MDEKEVPVINIKLKTTYVQAKTHSLKGKYHTLMHESGTHLITTSYLIYLFYKILWKIKPPKVEVYHSIDAEKHLTKILIDKLNEEKQ